MQIQEDQLVGNDMLPRGAGDPDFYGYPDQKDEPSKVDWAIAEINNQLITLEKDTPVGYVLELKDFQTRLQQIIDKAVKPF